MNERFPERGKGWRITKDEWNKLTSTVQRLAMLGPGGNIAGAATGGFKASGAHGGRQRLLVELTTAMTSSDVDANVVIWNGSAWAAGSETVTVSPDPVGPSYYLSGERMWVFYHHQSGKWIPENPGGIAKYVEVTLSADGSSSTVSNYYFGLDPGATVNVTANAAWTITAGKKAGAIWSGSTNTYIAIWIEC